MAKKGDYKGDLDIPRLVAAKDRARQLQEAFRKKRVDAVKMFAGPNWGNGGGEQPRYLNLIGNYIRIVSRHLISKDPRVLITTNRREHRPAVDAMQAWCNLEIQKMDLSTTLQRVVLDGLFSLGICKVALSAPTDYSVLHRRLKPGMPYAQRVDLDDWVHDPHARDLSEACFMGHRFRAPLNIVKEWDQFDKQVRKTLTATPLSSYNEQGDERIGGLQRGEYSGDGEEYEDYVDLWELYLPRMNAIVTLADDGSGETHEPLRVQEWLGPYCGPYHFPIFGLVPGNAWPKAPLMDLIDLDAADNIVWRKLVRQAARQKDNMLIPRGQEEDAERLKKAGDGDIVPYDGREPPGVVTWGAPNPANFQFGLSLQDQFNKQGGNLELLGGTSQQSKTASQDKMLNENAGGGISDLQESTVKFTSSVFKGLCWYWWNHPELVMESEYEEYAPFATATRKVHPFGKSKDMMGRPQPSREIPFDELSPSVDPYSLRHQTPEQKAQKLMNVMKEVVMPLAQLMAQQGITPDMQELLKILGEYLDMPELMHILSVQEPPSPDQQGGGGEPPGVQMPNGGEYLRRSQGSDGPGQRQADLKNMMAQMAGGNGQANGQMNGAMGR